ncbi:2-hydroxyacyl-CoA dehydratase subunit D [Gemmatimonadota bacterium]
MKRRILECTASLKETMVGYYLELGTAATEKSAPVAWCTSTGPVEILRALGYKVHFPENHSSMMGASRTANDYMTRAHARGYSQDICSYLTADIGAFLAGETPFSAFGIEEVPRPDVLVFNTNQCRDVRDWYEFFGRTWDVPVIGIESLHMIENVTDVQVDAIASQMEDLVPPLEEIAGTRLTSDRFGEILALSKECVDLWKSCMGMAAHRPAPLTFFDSTIHMGPVVTMRGIPAANEYYRLFLSELQKRVDDGVAAVEGERFRLYWEGMPVWGKLRELSELFASLSTTVVASTYCNSWIFDALDPADPFRSMARASLELFIVRSDSPKENYIEQMVREFSVDGIVFHDSRTCPNNSNCRYGMPERLREQLDIPVITIEGDQIDLRCYSSEQTKTSLEGFIEQLEDRSHPVGGADD